MTTYVVLDGDDLDVDKIWTSPSAYALYQNPIAITEGAAGAPNIQTAAITNLAVTEGKLANSAVAQGKLKTTTASGSVGLGSGNAGTYNLTGGTFSWWTASATASVGVGFGNGDLSAGQIGPMNIDPGAGATFFVDERYIQASPPYNLGNGDIALFVFALVAADGSLRGVSAAPDPTWAYHGPTNITPERIDAQGRAFRKYREVQGMPLADVLKDDVMLARVMRGEVLVDLVEREITQAIKNQDMNIFPHPWVGNALTGLTAVMLDPAGALVDRLAMIQADQGAAEVRRILDKGYLKIGSTPLAVAAPQGVMVAPATWK